MSYVTDVLLIFSLEENMSEGELLAEAPVIVGINSWLEDRDFAGLKNLSAGAGAEKAFQSNVYGGAYNFFDLSGFVEYLKGRTWRLPQSVQVLAKGEGDSKFTLINLTV